MVPQASVTRELIAVVSKPVEVNLSRPVSYAPRHRSQIQADRIQWFLITLIVVLVALSAVLTVVGFQRYNASTAGTKDRQNSLEQQFSTVQEIAPTKRPGPAALPIPGDAIARLIIPKIGGRWIVVEGVNVADIQFAPGHYPNSAMPGKVGNFAVAGHRSPAIFRNLDDLMSGDTVLVETQTQRLTYVVNDLRIVNPTELDVVAPNPLDPGSKPTKRFLTLTTCEPWWDNTHRLIVRAELKKTEKL